MTNVLGGVQRSTIPVKLLTTTGIILLLFIVLPLVLGEFQTALMAKLLLF